MKKKWRGGEGRKCGREGAKIGSNNRCVLRSYNREQWYIGSKHIVFMCKIHKEQINMQAEWQPVHMKI
jgi:hypothetical protein